MILIRDHLGLVKEGMAIALPLYQVMTLLDGKNTIRDLQTELMRQTGRVLVGIDEVKNLVAHLDDSFLLDSERFRAARDKIVADFTAGNIRPCSHCGGAYPENPSELKKRLDEIMASQPPIPEPEGKIMAVIAPHIDLSVGYKVYSSAYQMLKHTAPSRIVVLGVGHQMGNDLFCLTDKGFETPLGIIKSESDIIHELRAAGGDTVAATDFSHRSEHSIEFQIIFLSHLLEKGSFTIIPILCGSLQAILPEFRRDIYLNEAGPFISKLKEILGDPDHDTLLVTGVDFSHIGPKFGHEIPAEHLKRQSETHDKNLLQHLSKIDADHFWEESKGVKDQFNVCGFSALACMLEILPPGKGNVLDYEVWHEDATRSAVSFSAVAFTS
jgi:AmmeMemoRadiSam system protein B